ncbi:MULTISPECIES: transporter substrate-binding domain-containing protein [Erwinia]|uniref:transporter substrate-binding domain-containing protein n=1 Tax=Erwinia TaxID=551 RepID=UPI0005580071|nr:MULTISPECIES: transporter substrate-binding domain-containing protein [Erwinia]
MHQLVQIFLLACFSVNAMAAGTLRFTTSATNPPFEYYNADNTLTGFDIDLAEAICQRLNVTCQFTNNTFERLLPSLKYEHYDAAICALDITPARQEDVDFTEPYRTNSSSLIATKGRFQHISQLAGKRVGVVNGTTQQAWLAEAQPDIIAVNYDSFQNALLDIRHNRLDGIFGDTFSMRELFKTNPQLAQVGEPVTDGRYFGYGIGIAVHKNNTALKNSLNSALQSLKKDGTLEKLNRRWLGIQH